MLLKDVRIRDYRSIEDSGVVSIDPDVTCLVGKNESGKTAFLQALHLLNPLNPIAQEVFVSHANAALTPRTRLKVARLVIDEGWPIARGLLYRPRCTRRCLWTRALVRDGGSCLRNP